MPSAATRRLSPPYKGQMPLVPAERQNTNPPFQVLYYTLFVSVYNDLSISKFSLRLRHSSRPQPSQRNSALIPNFVLLIDRMLYGRKAESLSQPLPAIARLKFPSMSSLLLRTALVTPADYQAATRPLIETRIIFRGCDAQSWPAGALQRVSGKHRRKAPPPVTTAARR